MRSNKLLQTENIYHRRKSRQFNPRRLKKRQNHYSHNSRNAQKVRYKSAHELRDFPYPPPAEIQRFETLPYSENEYDEVHSFD